MSAHQVFASGRKELRRDQAAASARPLRELVIRRLTAGDAPAIEAHLLALEPVDRHSRFHALLGDEAVLTYARRIDFERMILIGAFDVESESLIGLAEAHLDNAAQPLRTEVSVSVLASRRGQSIGRLLVAVALDAAATRGARCADFYYRTGNRAIGRLVRDLGTPIATALGHASLALPLAPISSHQPESLDPDVIDWRR